MPASMQQAVPVHGGNAHALTLEVHDIRFGYGERAILDGVSLAVPRGELTILAGPNGAGKTTLLRCMLGLERPWSGAVTVKGRSLHEFAPAARARHLAWVPQSCRCRFPLSVFDMVMLGRRPHMGWKPSDADREIVAGVIEQLDLAALAFRDFDQLSGGQRQKVLTARAFAQQADFMLLDEPTSSLDLRHQFELLEILKEDAAQNRRGILIAIHDLNLALRFADSVALMHNGRLHGLGPAASVLTPDTIRHVYGMDATFASTPEGDWIIPVRAAGTGTSPTL